jgi:hypothetical protein
MISCGAEVADSHKISDRERGMKQALVEISDEKTSKRTFLHLSSIS